MAAAMAGLQLNAIYARTLMGKVMMSHTKKQLKEGRNEDYMYALTKPHGSCRGSSGSDMHKQIKNQNRDIKHPTA